MIADAERNPSIVIDPKCNDLQMIEGFNYVTFGNVIRIDLATGVIERLPGFTTTDEAALAFWDAVERMKGKR